MNYFPESCKDAGPIGVHLAVFTEPFLSYVLQGRKTIESRFSRVRCAPYGEIADGDVILIKAAAGPICAVTLARRTWFFDLSQEPLDQIRIHYGDAICADDAFWESKRDASFATLIELDETTPIDPMTCDKRDRRGWVPLRSRQLAFAF